MEPIFWVCCGNKLAYDCTCVDEEIPELIQKGYPEGNFRKMYTKTLEEYMFGITDKEWYSDEGPSLS